MFYQDSRVDKSECKNPVSYLKVTEFDVNGQVVGKKQVSFVLSNHVFILSLFKSLAV